jgi:hypothetical protein
MPARLEAQTDELRGNAQVFWGASSLRKRPTRNRIQFIRVKNASDQLRKLINRKKDFGRI